MITEAKTERNWALWRARVIDGRMLADIGSEYGIGPERVRQIVKKCARRAYWFVCWNQPEEGAEEALRGLEIVFPAGECPCIVAPDGAHIKILNHRR